MGDSIPKNVLDQLKSFDESMNEFENAFDEFLEIPYADQRPELEKARLNLTALFSLNSLYWVYVSCTGKHPKERDDLAIELKRTKDYMEKLKAFDEHHLRPQINQKGAKAFVRNSLFDCAAESSPMQEKRKLNDNEDWCKDKDEKAKKPKIK